MAEKFGQIYCQRCLAANALGQELCGRCGTRLMLVVEPSSLRYEEETGAGAAHDEHLLERVSTLESQLARVVEKLEQGIDLLFRQVRTSYMDHLLLETLIEALGETRAIDYKRLQKEWRERCERDSKEVEQSDRLRKLRSRVLDTYRGSQNETFARLVREGFGGLEKDEKRAVKTLERAAALAPDNSTLNAFLGEHFFRARKWTLARDYLERGLGVSEGDGRVQLLLGLVCGDEGDSERARNLLIEAVRLGGSSFAAHYALGSLFAAEENWKAALVEFKRALAARPSAEAHYVVGSAYHQLERPRVALRHLFKALEIDPRYAEAHYVLGLVYLRLGEHARAREAFSAAHAADRKEPRYLAAKRRRRPTSDVPPAPLFDALKRLKHRLMSGDDSRLALAVQEDALKRVLAR
ncbi:MAG TPA: tetratricopeptide repeat protein [Pyrinomonadaceae bacterium]